MMNDIDSDNRFVGSGDELNPGEGSFDQMNDQMNDAVSAGGRDGTQPGTITPDMKIAVIGSGMMGEAVIGGLLQRGIAQAEQIYASDKSAERGSSLSPALQHTHRRQ